MTKNNSKWPLMNKKTPQESNPAKVIPKQRPKPDDGNSGAKKK